jgi:alpha-galactosidase
MLEAVPSKGQPMLTKSPCLLILFSLPLMSQTQPARCMNSSDVIVATAIEHDMDVDARKPATQWKKASPVTFCEDWQGKNPDPERQTTVRVLWSAQMLYLRYECHYRELFLFLDSGPNGRRDHLWDRDVAEAFLQADPSQPRFYKEFEVAPNGFWIDLDIAPGADRDLKSGLRRSVWLNAENRVWAAELAIPMKALVEKFDPGAEWRANFYRIEGQKEPRFYSAWRATNTPEPNFHVPSAFGRLRFAAPGHAQ